MAGLVPAIPIERARPCVPKRDARHKAGHDEERSRRALVSSLGQLAQRRLGDLLGRDAEVAVKVLGLSLLSWFGKQDQGWGGNRLTLPVDLSFALDAYIVSASPFPQIAPMHGVSCALQRIFDFQAAAPGCVYGQFCTSSHFVRQHDTSL